MCVCVCVFTTTVPVSIVKGVSLPMYYCIVGNFSAVNISCVFLKVNKRFYDDSITILAACCQRRWFN